MNSLTSIEKRLVKLGHSLINQKDAKIIVPPLDASTGYWFGGGNVIQDPDGNLYLVGRYRNFGDSRTGVGAGERGLELAIFESKDQGETFQKIVSLSKSDLNVGKHEVLSIEGCALHWTDEGVELFISTEKKNLPYPKGYEELSQTGTGVWTIDQATAKSVADLQNASPKNILQSSELNTLHVKDPFVYDMPNGDTMLLFCTHPFNWSSSNTAFAIRPKGENAFGEPVYGFFPRGMSWDVAMTRGTAVLDVPKTGEFKDKSISLMFYDGGECVRNMDEHSSAIKRPRGYSCEELGGLAYLENGNFNDIHRLSKYEPMFVSDSNTGCSRYVDVIKTKNGLFATWQQSQANESQPLVAHFLSNEEIEGILS